ILINCVLRRLLPVMDRRETLHRCIVIVGSFPLTEVFQRGHYKVEDSGRVFPEEKLMRLNRAAGISAVVVSIVMVGASLAGDAVESGPKVGDFVGPFDVDDITGPNKGKTLCYR